MTDKHPITCIAISAAIALKLLAGTANAAPHSADVFNQAGSSATPQVQLEGPWTSPGSTARSSTVR
jgi:hypothetical protein